MPAITTPFSLRAARTKARLSTGLATGLAAGLAALLLGGCASIPHDAPSQSRLSGPALGLGATPAAPPAAPIAADWWQGLGDPALAPLMADALAGSPTIAQAQIRLKLAGAALSAARATQLPSATLDASVERQRFSANYIYPPPFGGANYWISNAEADVSWTLDFAGKQKALVAATRAGQRAMALDLAAARVALQGALAQGWVGLARANRQEAIAQSFVASREASLALIATRRRAGLASDLDMAAAQTLLDQARQNVLSAHASAQTLRHALAALAGRGPDYGAALPAPRLDLAGALPVPGVLPADLLARRADIAAQRQLVEANLQGITAARADFYPNVNLRAFVGAQALGIGSLFAGDALTAGAGPAVHLPLFEGGALRARYRAAVSFADNAIAGYNAAVIAAVRQAADALTAAEASSAEARQQGRIIAGLDQTVALDHRRMASGLATRLDILSADERLLAARQAEVDLLADALDARIRLAVALGGGFAPDAPL